MPSRLEKHTHKILNIM